MNLFPQDSSSQPLSLRDQLQDATIQGLDIHCGWDVRRMLRDAIASCMKVAATGQSSARLAYQAPILASLIALQLGKLGLTTKSEDCMVDVSWI